MQERYGSEGDQRACVDDRSIPESIHAAASELTGNECNSSGRHGRGGDGEFERLIVKRFPSCM